MANQRTRVAQAISLHVPAAATVTAASELLQAYCPANAAAEYLTEQRELTARLRAAATELAPGWLGAPLDALAATTPIGGATPPTFVRIGQAQVFDDAQFPVIVPLLRAGHIALDADARDPRVAGLLRTLLLRLLATAPVGSLAVRVVDSAQVGATFDAFDPAVVPPAVTDQRGLRELLCEAERWVAERADEPGAPTFLMVIASLPELTDGSDFARITALAKAGPARRLHLIAAGWPPPPLTAETTQRPLPYCTQLALRNPHAWVGDPPGASFNANGIGPGRLRAPVYLDPDPPADLIRRTCARLVSAEALTGQPLPTGAVPTPTGAIPTPTGAVPTPTGAVPTPTGAVPAAGLRYAAWSRYVAAAQRLAAATKAAAAVTAEQEAARKATLGQLSATRTRVARQGAVLAQLAIAAGLPPPIPDPRRVSAARSSMAAATTRAPEAATAALFEANRALDAADATLTGTDAGGRRRLLRNAAIYGLFAFLAAVVQVPLTIVTGAGPGAAVVTVPCTLLLPAIAFGAAWAVVGAVSDERDPDRTPLAGLALTVIATTPLITIALLTVIAR